MTLSILDWLAIAAGILGAGLDPHTFPPAAAAPREAALPAKDAPAITSDAVGDVDAALARHNAAYEHLRELEKK